MSSGQIRVTGYHSPAQSPSAMQASQGSSQKVGTEQAPKPQAQGGEQRDATLDLLRFIALSTSVHADAAQTSSDEVQSALMQMRAEEDALNHLDRKLRRLLNEQHRLQTMQAAITRSKESRRKGEEILQEHERGMRELAAKSRDGGRVIQSSSSRHYTGDTRSRRQEQVGSGGAQPDGATTSEECQQQLNAVNRDVEKVRLRLSEATKMSVKAKLVELELMKQAARDVDATALMKELVVGFQFPAEVEALWCDDDRTGSTAGGPDSSSAARVSEAPIGRRSSTAAPGAHHSKAHVRDFRTANSSPASDAVVTHATVDLLIARALQRLTGRYRDSMALLTKASVDKDCRPQQVFASLLYAEYLDATEGNPDAAAVREMQAFGKTTLSDFYKRKCKDTVVDGRISESCLTGRHGEGEARGNPRRRNSASTSVLSPYVFCALPTNWPATEALTDLSHDVLLPPARHILSRRFSFADVRELRRLEALRVDVQRKLVQDLQDDCKVLDDVLRVNAQNMRAPPSRTERAVADARMAVVGLAPPTKPHAYPTIVSTAGDDR